MSLTDCPPLPNSYTCIIYRFTSYRYLFQELYDPYRFGAESYYEVLSKAQDVEEHKRLAKESSRAKINPPVSEIQIRKTKWDMGRN